VARRNRSLERTKKRRSRLFVWFERAVLGFGMSVMAFFIERKLLKALRAGSVKPAPRTAAGPEEPDLAAGEESQPRAEVTTRPHFSD
jgi:hypothetical protein